MDRKKFIRAEEELQKVDPRWELDDFGDTVGSYWITLLPVQGNGRKRGDYKRSLVIRSKAALRKHGSVRWHEWHGNSLNICVDL